MLPHPYHTIFGLYDRTPVLDFSLCGSVGRFTCSHNSSITLFHEYAGAWDSLDNWHKT